MGETMRQKKASSLVTSALIARRTLSVGCGCAVRASWRGGGRPDALIESESFVLHPGFPPTPQTAPSPNERITRWRFSLSLLVRSPHFHRMVVFFWFSNMIAFY